MIDLNGPHWENLQGGYRMPYDPRPALRRLEAEGNYEQVWEELWEELHHQGDIGDASYAAVVALVDMQKRQHNLDWNLYGIAATIEVERHRKTNPPVPEWLVSHYHQAWKDLLEFTLEDLRSSKDATCIEMALAVIALARGLTKLGAVIWDSRVDDLVEEYLAWTDLYHTQPPP